MTASAMVEANLSRQVHSFCRICSGGCGTLLTIDADDRIVVLVHGKIVEIGSHAELLAKGGAYASLYHSQFEQEVA